MAVTYGFYNSLNHDRTYDAIQMSSIFDGIIKDGIFEAIGDQLEVSANSGMIITVGTGRAWFDHTWTLNDSLLPLEVEEAEIVLDRIDSVILEVNADIMTRANSIYILKGSASSSPVHPSLINTEDIHQYRLADITVGAGVTEITQANITNYIGTSDTPFITGVLETMDVDMLVAQWQDEYRQMTAADHQAYTSSLNADHTAYENQRMADDASFDAWFQNKMNEVLAWYQNLQVTIDQNVAVKLQNEIGTLSLLQTQTKTNLVAAINELVTNSYPCFIRATCAEDFAGNRIELSYNGQVVDSKIVPSVAPYIVEFAVKETGLYTVTETVNQISAQVTVTNYTIYNVGLYLGSIVVTVDEAFIGRLITCSDGHTTKTWTADGLTHTFSVGLGTWTIKGVTASGVERTATVNVTEYTQYTAALYLGAINLTCDEDFIGHNITCSDGNDTITWMCTGTTHTFSVGLGTWTISSTIDGNTFTTEVTVTEYTEYDAELHTNIELNLTVYSAAADTVYYYEDNNTSTTPITLCTTNNSGEGSGTIVIPGNGNKTITFYSTIAKDTTSGTNIYSKSVNLTNGTTELKVMPEGAVYWYGWKLVEPHKSGQGGTSASGGFNTNEMYTACAVDPNTSDASYYFDFTLPNGFKEPFTTIKAIGRSTTTSWNSPNGSCKKTNSSGLGAYNIGTFTVSGSNYSLISSSTEGWDPNHPNNVTFAGTDNNKDQSANTRYAYCKAIWLE